MMSKRLKSILFKLQAKKSIIDTGPGVLGEFICGASGGQFL